MKTPASLLALLFLSGCIIGTWPTPEANDKSPTPTQQPTAEEGCDGIDNDADGVIDEGCSCGLGDARGCIGILEGQCGLGVQRCAGGLWGECVNVGPPWSAATEPEIVIIDVTPAVLTRGATEVVTVKATVGAACAGIQVARVDATLASSEPVVRVRAAAEDDGVPPDVVAGDGEYAAGLVNVFGPGVVAQPLSLRVTATIHGHEAFDAVTVDLEEP